MRKGLFLVLSLIVMGVLCNKADACTNVIITRGASTDCSIMVSYAADSYWTYGELYFHPAKRWKKGSMLKIRDWDTYEEHGEIPQLARTYKTVGNMNEHQLIITETTFGGRMELMDTAGIMDYGSLIYVTLQRARTAREAIETLTNLANEYGYPSEGESFSIADANEAWVMDLIGKGPDNKGVVWVAMKVPDGYICAHANQSRISTFPLDDPENCLYAPDVISFAREKGYFEGEDNEFSFCAAYAPLDFLQARACEARVWSAFNILTDGEFTFMKDGEEVSVPAEAYLNYAMGYDNNNPMPLFVKPSKKISVKDVADVMRDHYEGTPMDMTRDVGAGGCARPYRMRPLEWEYEGKSYVNERGIATQQTGFWMVGQARADYPNEVGGILWFGVDDAASSYLTPIYTNVNQIPDCLRQGNGDLLHYSPTSQFWINNRIAQACYRMYRHINPFIREKIDDYENTKMFSEVPQMDAKLLKLVNKGRKARARRLMTRFCVKSAQEQFGKWVKLEEVVTVKFNDGVIKSQNEDGSFAAEDVHPGMPKDLQTPGYTEEFKKIIVEGNPSLEVK